MDKEEILKKSRSERRDEGEEFVMNRGRSIGVMGMMMMFVVLIVFNLFTGTSNYGIFALFWTYMGLESFGRYRLTKQTALLVGGIAGILAGVLNLVNHIVSILR